MPLTPPTTIPSMPWERWFMEEILPQSIVDLDRLFPDEDACRGYLSRLRWPDGFVCPRCESRDAWQASRGRWVCRSCRYQATVTAGTIFQDTRLPLQLWFHAIWQILSQKNAASAANVQRSLGLRTYRTAWTWLHKLRRAMVLPGRVALSGQVEMDETYLGGPEAGTAGRALGDHKQLIAIAAEKVGSGIGRIRLACLANATREQLHGFIRQNIQTGCQPARKTDLAYRLTRAVKSARTGWPPIAAWNPMATGIRPRCCWENPKMSPPRYCRMCIAWPRCSNAGSSAPTSEASAKITCLTISMNSRFASAAANPAHPVSSSTLCSTRQ